MADPSVRSNLFSAINKAIASDGKVHIMGLCSDGGVHSDINYMKNQRLIG